MKKLHTKKSVLLAALISGTFAVGMPVTQAADEMDATLNQFQLEQIVVTATRTPVEIFKAQANVSVITSEDIEKKNYKDLYTALRDVPGIQTWGYGQAGYLTSNSLRINGSEKIIVLIDGVRVNQGAEIFSPGTISNMDNIERVEVLKGSASALYGADAQGGVINIITKKGGLAKSKLYFDAGNFGRQDYGAVINARDGKFGVTLGAHKKKEGDFESARNERVISNAETNNWNVNLNYDIKDNSDIRLNYDNMNYRFFYSTPGTGDSHPGSFDSTKANMIWRQEFDNDTHNVFSIGSNRKNYETTWGTSTFRSLLLQEQISRKTGAHLLTVGVDYEGTKVINQPSYNAKYIGEKLNTSAYYLQDQIDLTDRFKFIAGIRYTDPNKFDAVWTPSFNLGYDFNENTNMYVSWNKFFDTPTISQMYGAEHGNSNLKPEDGKNFEVGFNHKFNDKLALAGHYFYRNTTNFVAYDSVTKHYYNKDNEVRTKGFDVQINKVFDDHWKAKIAYTYIQMPQNGTDLKGQENYGGFLPRSAWNIGLDYTEDKYDVGLTGRGIIKRPGYTTEYGPYFPNDTYWVFDVNASYRPTKNFRLYANVYNLFNQYYAEASDVYWRDIGYGSLGGNFDYWPQAGRSFILGMEYSF